MSGPWERYQQEAGPWTKYGAAEAPIQPAPEKPKAPAGMQTIANIGGGLIRGAGSIGATLLTPYDLIAGNTKSIGNPERRAAMDGGMQALGVDTDSMAYGGGKLAGEVAGTLGVGGGIANVVGRAAPALAARAAPALDAVRTAGMSAGGATGARGVALRAAGGGTTGAAAAGLVNPEDAATGATIGAALPGVVQFLGRFGSVVGGVFKPRDAKAGADLAKALDLLNPADRAAVVAQLRAAPELVLGSRPTVAQALQTPQAGILERVVSDSAGGAALKSQQAAQNAARLAALERVAPTVPTGAATARQDLGEALTRYAVPARAGKRAQTSALYKSVPQDEAAIYPPNLAAIRDEFYPPGAFTDRGMVDRAVSKVDELGSQMVEPPKLPSATAAARTKSLSQAVRSAGGIDIMRAGGRVGEVRGLTGDIKNLIRKNGGLTLERMAEKMEQAGYIADNGVDTLLDALKNDARVGPQFSMQDLPEAAWQRAAYADAPTQAERVPLKMTLRDIEAMRSSVGQAARQATMQGDDKAATALGRMKTAFDDRIDEVVRGDGMIDENLPIDWADKLSAARKSKMEEVQRFGTGPQAAIFRKGSDGAPLLQGGEVAAKFWGNRPGLADDVKSLRRLIEDEPRLLGQFRSMVTTEGAGTATNAGNLTGKFARWVENTLPGLKAGFEPDQVKALQRIADDIKRAEAAAAAGMSRGSNTYQNAQNALSIGLLDNPLVSAGASRIPFAGAGIDWLRESATKGKARRLADVLADSEAAANALQLLQPRPAGPINPLLLGGLRAAPLLGGSR